MSGANVDSTELTNIRIFVRLDRGSFVTFRIFVLALENSQKCIYGTVEPL